jgi:hypothetical protein
MDAPTKEITSNNELQSPKLDWQRIITQWQSSGLSQIEFCKAHQLNYKQFTYQHSKLKKPNGIKSSIPKLLPVNLISDYHSTRSEDNAFLLYLPNGVKLSIPINTKLEVIKFMLDCLGLR